jgi:hypothetical protein
MVSPKGGASGRGCQSTAIVSAANKAGKMLETMLVLRWGSGENSNPFSVLSK